MGCPTPESAPVFSAFDTILKILTKRGNMAGTMATLRNALAGKLGIPTEQNTKFNNAMARLEAKVGDITRARLAARARGSVPAGEADAGSDLLDHFLGAGGAGGAGGGCPVAGMQHSLVVDNVKTFLFAGHDTTASALAWALYLVATHPKTRARLLDEAREAGVDTLAWGPGCTDGSGGVSHAAIQKLRHLDAVVKEVLRLHPSAGFTRRVVDGPVTLGGGGGKDTADPVTIPPGVEVFVFP